jgi:hypothetical protein
MILRRALEWESHLCRWGRRAFRLPRDEFAVVEPAAYHFETAGRLPAFPTAKMAVPPIHRSKKTEKSLLSVSRFNKPGELSAEKIQEVLTRFWRSSHKRGFTLKFHHIITAHEKEIRFTIRLL